MASSLSSTVAVRNEFTSQEGNETGNAGEESYPFQTTEGGFEIKTEEVDIDNEPEYVVSASKSLKPSRKVKRIKCRKVKRNKLKTKKIKDRGKVKEKDPLGLPSEYDNDWHKAVQTHDKEKHIQVRRDLTPTLTSSNPTAIYDNPNFSQNTAAAGGRKNRIRVRKDLGESPFIRPPPIFYDDDSNIRRSTTVSQRTNRNHRLEFTHTVSVPSNCFETVLMNGNSLSSINQEQIYYANGIFFTVNTGIISSDIQPGAFVVSNDQFENNVVVDSYLPPYNLTTPEFLTSEPQSYQSLETNICKISTKSGNRSKQKCRKVPPKKPASKALKKGPPIPNVPSFNDGPPILSMYASNCHFGVGPVSSADHFGEFQQRGPNYSSCLQFGGPVVLKDPLGGKRTRRFQTRTNGRTKSRASAKSHLFDKDKNCVKRNTSIRGFDCAAWQPRVLLRRSDVSEYLMGASKCGEVHKSRFRCQVSKVSSVKKKPSKSKRPPGLKGPLVSTPIERSSNSSLDSKKSSHFNGDSSVVDEKLFSEAQNVLPEGHFMCVHCSATFKTKNALRSHRNDCSAEKPAVNDSTASSQAEQESQQSPAHKLVYSCVQCSTKFKNKKKLMRHLQTHMNNKYSCAHCPATFTHKPKIRYHLRYDHADKDFFECEPCSLKFATNTEARKHSAIAHGNEKPHACTQCPKRFRYRTLLLTHLSVHATDRPFSCPDCPATFKDKIGLKIHSVVHSGERPYLCEHCAKTFKSKNEVAQHLKLHSGERPHKCAQCPAAFYHITDLKRHSSIHGNEKPFPCSHPNCLLAFKNKAYLRKHLLVHSGERPFACDKCPARFKRKDIMRSHREKCKSNNYDFSQNPDHDYYFSCHCGRIFKTEDDFRMHWVIHSDKEPEESLLKQGEKQYACVDCPGVKFWAKEDLEAHMAYHTNERPFACKHCSNSFKNRKSLMKHLKVHSDEKKHLCPQCGAAFKIGQHLTRHMSVHSKDKPFLCSHCAKTFKSSLGLKYHVEHAHSKGIEPISCVSVIFER